MQAFFHNVSLDSENYKAANELLLVANTTLKKQTQLHIVSPHYLAGVPTKSLATSPPLYNLAVDFLLDLFGLLRLLTINNCLILMPER